MTFLLGFGLFSEGLWRVGTQKIEDNWVLGIHMDVSENSGTPKSSILIGFSIINHPFLGTTIFGNTHIIP